MNRFVQLHLLTSYPPANLNRDDLGRPKTAVMGGATRLRVSSQSLKRSWRTSDIFRESLGGCMGTRTKRMGIVFFSVLQDLEVEPKKAMEWAQKIAGVFGKLKSLPKKEQEALKNLSEEEQQQKQMVTLEIEQLAHFSPEEITAIQSLCIILAEKDRAPKDDELALLRSSHRAVDIALFGRMLASSPEFNTEAAAQVAHAISTHKVAVEDDFFTAVDDLNDGSEDMGAGHMGDTEFAAGLFYLYICIDKELLIKNLSGDTDLADRTVDALVNSAAQVAPTGKQNSFASRARASYILCETGDQQPRSLSVAFLKPIYNNDMLNASINALEENINSMDKAYGACADNRCTMNTVSGEGTLTEIVNCATGA
ncbi:MAG: type I-E CRISPR-associated protein Cas7/Cse4/CasC [Rhodospirillaceae bacterium]|nr:type I-E CRISPR-associated protein Cas7/Cse4/CasC [Rhodospirillaceae bacterium]|tara:strand:+ start:3316 stop:4419 length:1104 start_codon:yes stop_codon:yes gene_type:complete